MVKEARGFQFVESVAQELKNWMTHVRRDAHGALPTLMELRELRNRIEQAGSAISERDRSSHGREWSARIASYRKSLEELSSFLREFDINLRIRRAEMETARGRIQATNAWADAVKKFG
jgi:hypothetical protein